MFDTCSALEYDKEGLEFAGSFQPWREFHSRLPSIIEQSSVFDLCLLAPRSSTDQSPFGGNAREQAGGRGDGAEIVTSSPRHWTADISCCTCNVYPEAILAITTLASHCLTG